MNLGAILLIIIFCALPALPVVGRNQSAPASAPVNAGGTTKQDPTQTSPSEPQAPPASAAPTSSGQNPVKPTKRRRQKTKPVSNCSSAPTSGSGRPASSDATVSGNAAVPGTASAPANCPPSKVIVQQGGTADKSIQLAGAGAGSGTSSNSKDTANQMLAATESNLKRLSGQQLSSNQQDMVSQIRQFMEQSKAAVGDGDMERARTLAWKAQVLSEELVKPAQ